MTDPQHPVAAIDLERAVFQSNARYELVLFDRLSAAEQELLADLRKQPELYGVLRPTDESGLSVKSVGRETALLYLTMREQGTLPEYARALAAADHGAGIARLVLDQILEIRHGDRFVSGGEAYELLYGARATPVAGNRLQQLSIAALRYGESLAVADVGELSLRLYNYHRLPITSRWRHMYGDPARVAERLGVASGGRYAAFLESRWQAVTETGGDERSDDRLGAGWLSWVTRRQPAPQAGGATITHKLYVSPMPEFVDNVFAITLKTLTETQALQLKVGADAEGLLRPDKCVAYFSSSDALRHAADALAPRLDGCPAHGVPFTAALDDEGLLSWGVDPPASQHLLNWQPRESWRFWLTNRLANALLTAKRASVTSATRYPPWQYALERVRLEGVDTTSWTPTDTLWGGPGTH
jgi:hypothetical protein